MADLLVDGLAYLLAGSVPLNACSLLLAMAGGQQKLVHGNFAPSAAASLDSPKINKIPYPPISLLPLPIYASPFQCWLFRQLRVALIN
jgi:hypothetical protein